MAVTNMTFTPTVEAGLRDSMGHELRVGRVTAAEGTYTTGGVTLDPTWFDLLSIEHIHIENSLVMDLGDGWFELCKYAVRSLLQEDGTLEWKIIVFLNNMDNTFSELPDGGALSLNDDVCLSLMIIGSKDNR
jgi:hypothetical protein